MQRSSAIFAGGLIFVFAVVGIAYFVLIAGDDLARSPPAAVVAPVAIAAPAARFGGTKGRVEVRLGEGEWKAADTSAPLLPGTEVRTAADAVAAVAYGDNVKIELRGQSEVRLAELRAAGAKLVIGEGLVLADVLPGFGAVQFASRNGEAVAETADGALVLSTDAQGSLRTAVTRGEATLSANGAVVTVQAGFYSIAGAGRKPTAPAELPRSLLLKVKWPSGATTAKRRQLVSGTAGPASRVRVGESVVYADAEGRFQTIVDLKEGSNRIELRAVDLAGREAGEVSPAIELDTKAPAQVIETSPGMWRKTARDH